MVETEIVGKNLQFKDTIHNHIGARPDKRTNASNCRRKWNSNEICNRWLRWFFSESN